MAFNIFKRLSGIGEFWRDENGDIRCPGMRFCRSKQCNSTCPIWLSTQGGLMIQKGNIDQAEAYFDKAIELAPDFFDPWNNKGLIYGQKQMYKEAYDCYKNAHLIRQDKIQPIYGLALSSKDLKKYDECLEWCIKFRELSNNNVVDGIYNEALSVVNARIKKEREQKEAKERSKEKKLSKNDNSCFWRNSEGIIHCPGENNCSSKQCDSTCPIYLSKQGEAMMESGSLDQAETYFDKALKLDPYFCSVLRNKGHICEQKRMYKESYDFYKRAYEISPTMSPVRGLAQAAKELGKYDECFSWCILANKKFQSLWLFTTIEEWDNTYSNIYFEALYEVRAKKVAGSMGENEIIRREYHFAFDYMHHFIEEGVSDGIFEDTAYIPLDKELLLLSRDVIKQIIGTLDEYFEKKGTTPSTYIKHAWGFYAGVAAAYLWHENPNLIKEHGVFETISGKRGINCLDEYVQEEILEISDDAKLENLRQHLLNLSIELEYSNAVVPCDVFDPNAEEQSVFAMYLYGMETVNKLFLFGRPANLDGNISAVDVAKELINIAVDDGYLTNRESFPNMPEVVVQAKKICLEIILKMLDENEEKNTPTDTSVVQMTWLRLCYYIGLIEARSNAYRNELKKPPEEKVHWISPTEDLYRKISWEATIYDRPFTKIKASYEPIFEVYRDLFKFNDYHMTKCTELLYEHILATDENKKEENYLELAMGMYYYGMVSAMRDKGLD